MTVSGGTLNYTLATTATKFSNVGDYPITVTLGRQPQLHVTKTDGTLTHHPEGSHRHRRRQDQDLRRRQPDPDRHRDRRRSAAAPVNYTLATTATKYSNVGDYPINVTLGSNPNYT